MLHDARKLPKDGRLAPAAEPFSSGDIVMAFNLSTEEEAQAILADQRDGGIIMHDFLDFRSARSLSSG